MWDTEGKAFLTSKNTTVVSSLFLKPVVTVLLFHQKGRSDAPVSPTDIGHNESKSAKYAHCENEPKTHPTQSKHNEPSF